MDDARSLKRDRRRRVLPAALLALCAVAVIAAAAKFYLFPTVSVADLVADVPALGEPRDVTATYCAQEIPCTEAWETPLGTYMKFGSEAEAEHWGIIIGADGAQWKEFVLDARAVDLTDDERMTAVQVLLSYDGV